MKPLTTSSAKLRSTAHSSHKTRDLFIGKVANTDIRFPEQIRFCAIFFVNHQFLGSPSQFSKLVIVSIFQVSFIALIEAGSLFWDRNVSGGTNKNRQIVASEIWTGTPTMALISEIADRTAPASWISLTAQSIRSWEEEDFYEPKYKNAATHYHGGTAKCNVLCFSLEH